MITPRTTPRITPRIKTTFLVALKMAVLATSLAVSVAKIHAQTPARAATTDQAEEKHWLAVAPGRVEPLSGVIRVAVPVMGVVGEVLVRANDKVFAGEALIRLVDPEVRARLVAAEAQVALRKRVRNKESAASGAAPRRKAEDAVADAEKAVSETRSLMDKAAAERRAGRGSDTDLDAARSGLTRAQDRVTQQKAELRRIEADAPLPTLAEGQLNIARGELLAAQAAVEKMIIRAPIDGSILQMNAKAGELASPSTPQPLVLLGNVQALRVRAEVDERDIEKIKLGQAVLVRPAAFRGREIAGTVSFIAPLVEAGRNNSLGQRNMTDVDVVEVMVDLGEPGPLAVGMKVDVYFRPDSAARN
jgi:HlyD family secretion protein